MTQAPAKHDRYLNDHRAFEVGLPSGQPRWLQELRGRALQRFSELGFPTARKGNEPWKYTNVAPIAEGEFVYPADGGPEPTPRDLRRLAPWRDDWINAVFVNGRYSPALSSAPSGVDIPVTSLAQTARSDGAVLQEHLGRYAPFDNDSFAALNTAFVHDGAFVHLPQGQRLRVPLHLLFVTAGDRPVAAYPRALVMADAHSEATIIESYVSLSPGPSLTDGVTEIVARGGASLDHYRLLLEDEKAYHVGITRVYQEQDSTFSTMFFGRGSGLGRNDLQVLLDGPGSASYLNGLYVTTGSQHIDNYINIDHAKPHTTSRLYYKGILDGKSRAVFGGTVFVRPGAVKTDAHQEDKNLILSDEAEVDSKPSLEIYADDVKCGHGATAGSVTDDAIFYMRSRGLDVETATAYLIKGFARQVLDTVKVAPLRSYMERRVAQALKGVRFGGWS